MCDLLPQRITDLLLEVNRWKAFTRYFVHLKTGEPDKANSYVDGAYISGRVIDKAKEEGWQLMGPAQPSASRAGLEKAYRIEAFAKVDLQNQLIAAARNIKRWSRKLLGTALALEHTVSV